MPLASLRVQTDIGIQAILHTPDPLLWVVPNLDPIYLDIYFRLGLGYKNDLFLTLQSVFSIITFIGQSVKVGARTGLFFFLLLWLSRL
mgnify:CR=1 FL=1